MRFYRKTLYSHICSYAYKGFCRDPPCLWSKSQLVEQGLELEFPLEILNSVWVKGSI